MTETNLTQVFDAKVWAQEFCKVHSNFDEQTMIAWFANAIMAGYDHARRENNARVPMLSDRDAKIRKECADRAVAWAKKWAEFPMGNHGTKALRAAIMGDQEKEND